MSIFANLNKSFESPFTLAFPDDVDFKKLADLDINQTYKLMNCYINTKSKYGEHPIAGVMDSDGICFNLSLPRHLNEIIRTILGSQDYINAINAGEAFFSVKKCNSKKYNKDFLTIEFI